MDIEDWCTPDPHYLSPDDDDLSRIGLISHDGVWYTPEQVLAFSRELTQLVEQARWIKNHEDSRPAVAEELDRFPVGRYAKDAKGRLWRHVRASRHPWDDVSPAWVPVALPGDHEGDFWRPEPQSDTLNLITRHGPFLRNVF